MASREPDVLSLVDPGAACAPASVTRYNVLFLKGKAREVWL
jgi:hypothetical protein